MQQSVPQLQQQVRVDSINKGLANSVYLDVPSIQHSYRQKINQLYKEFDEGEDPKKGA